MFAVVKIGGGQFKVCQNDVIDVDFMGAAEPASKHNAKAVGVFNDSSELVSTNSIVEYEVVEHTKADKKFTFKKERRTTHKKKIGNRQKLTTIKILSIKA